MTNVSVVLVAHNSSDCVERALGSIPALLSSSGRGDARPIVPTEVVLVDNASTDGTVELVRTGFPLVRVIEVEKNLGFGRACNLAAKETTGDLILFLNPDAWLVSSCLDDLVRAMEADLRVGLAVPHLQYPEGRRQFDWGPTIGVVGEVIQRLRNAFESRTWVHDGLPRLLRFFGDPGWHTAACALVRRCAWEEVGGFDPGYFLYFEDADLGLRLRRAGWRLIRVNRALAVHDKKGPSASVDRLVRYRESQLRFYRQNRPRWESRLLLARHTRGLHRIRDHSVRAQLLVVVDQARDALEQRFDDLPTDTAELNGRRRPEPFRSAGEGPRRAGIAER
jgi:GT2 family glycosyltransferase